MSNENTTGKTESIPAQPVKEAPKPDKKAPKEEAKPKPQGWLVA